MTRIEIIDQEIAEAEREISRMQNRINALGFERGKAECEASGKHRFVDFTKPPIGRACCYCRKPEASA